MTEPRKRPAAGSAGEAERPHQRGLVQDEPEVSPSQDQAPADVPAAGSDSKPSSEPLNEWQTEAAGWVSSIPKKAVKASAKTAPQAPAAARLMSIESAAISGVVAFLALACVLAVYVIYQEEDPQTRLMEKSVLAMFNGERGAPLYVAILGEVFDVSRKPEMYGIGAGYHHFVGVDASRAFLTGDKAGDSLTDDVADLTDQQYASLVSWRSFYRKEYTWKGRLVGRFFSLKGRPFRQMAMVEERAARAASAEEVQKQADALHPRCGVRWSAADGGLVFCEDGLFPRKVFQQQPGGAPQTRCACFKELGWSDLRQVYPDCSPQASECSTSPAKPIASA